MAKVYVEPGPDDVDVELLSDEKTQWGLMMEEGITTISFYKGDFQAAVDALIPQFKAVVSFNPWLSGRLIQGQDKQALLRHKKTPTDNDIDSLFTISSIKDDNAKIRFNPTTPYTTICSEMCKFKKEFIVSNGGICLSGNEALVKLILSESKPGEYALIFSMSHVIGDGKTYYDILKMLDSKSDIKSLPTKRVMEFSEAMRDNCGRKELQWIESTDATCIYMCGLVLPSSFGCGKKPICHAFYLDDEKIANEKKKVSDVEYISTNDILTSSFFNVVKARIGMMGMDCRERLPGITKDLAGNYVTALTMDPTTFDTPSTIRKMLSSTPYITTTMPMPSCFNMCCGKGGTNMAMITNWSTFAGDLIKFESSERIIHLPIQDPALAIFDLMIPFASGNDGKKGVIVWTISTDLDGLRNALPVSEQVSKELFP